METLYLFTDGGMYDIGKSIERMSSSFIFCHKKEVICEETVVTPGGTSPLAEATAFYNGVCEVLKYVNDIPGDYRIEMVVDSELTYKTFNEWIFNWMKKAGGLDQPFKSASGSLVKNQEIIKKTFKKLVKIKEKHRLEIMHINSHIETKGVDYCWNRFNIVNKKELSKEEFLWYSFINSLVDKKVNKAGSDKSLIVTKQ